MFVSLNWIKEFVNLDGIEVDELVRKFGLATAEVESVTYKGKDIENVVVAEILTVENHPNSNHLHILTVNDGSENAPVQVVCGAPNVRVGLKTYFARVGGNVCGVKIKPAKLAGVESFGMCCGGNELGIESDDSGIVELPSDAKIGANIKDVLPVEDVLIEIDNKSLTNRPDLWGHYGFAREFAVIFKRDLKEIPRENCDQYNNLNELNINVDTDKCFRYCGITVNNVTSKKSTEIMKLRLNYCGMRDINLLADMTNYLMLELGQPMHAFDNAIVKDIDVIKTDKEISMLTLENETHTIPTESIVICNNNKEPLAIAGIKGGMKSGISDSTNSLLLESACFDCGAIRKASRKIGLITDASLRYEKSLDPEMCKIAIERLVYLLKQADSGVKVTSKLTDRYNYHYPKLKIETDSEFISRRGGVKLSLNEIKDTLERLGFKVDVTNEAEGKFIAHVPSYRATKDISIREDLVEEVYRIYGYDNIKSATIDMPLKPVSQIPEHLIEYRIKYELASRFGLNEVHSYIWNYPDFNKDMGITENSVLHLLDSSHSGQSGLRTELIPSLLKICSENTNNFKDVSIFEIARVFDELDNNNLCKEKKKLSIVLASETKDEKTLYFTLKEIVEYISKFICSIKVNYEKCENKSGLFHPINSSAIVSGETVIGDMGILYPSIAKNIDKRKRVAVLELDIDKLIGAIKLEKRIIKTSKYQSNSLDFNFVIDNAVPYGEIEKALNEFRCNYLIEYSLKDIYKNEEVLPGKTSYTINYIITPKDKTLEASDIEKFSNRLVAHMQRFNILLRV